MHNKDIFQHYNHLGFFNPYYVENNKGFFVHNQFSKIVSRLETERIVDTTAILEILNQSYILGDRTLIQGVFKSPWMARPDDELKQWNFFQVPDHDEKEIDEAEIAKVLFDKLSNEILGYVGEHKTIGILLSGGMDSRMVAGILDHLMKTGAVPNINVVGLTWGNKDSRDVIYAKRITELLNWEWKHFELTPEDFQNNIKTAALHGAEYSAVHLHAMPQISKERGIDCILAGSFGDSIGRAEYSGVKVSNITSLAKKVKNFGKVLKVGLLSKFLEEVHADINSYHLKYPQEKKYQQYEQDYQLHYMRRMLNPCMAVINNNIPLYQAFSSPDVFGYMWKISPKNRTDKVYELMLDLFPSKLKNIPWARTGLPYGQMEGTPDQHNKKNHSYTKMMTSDVYEFVQKNVLSNAIDHLNVFNMDSLKVLLKLIKENPAKNFDYIEKLTWIASLSIMVNSFEVSGIESNPNVFLNKVNSGILSPAEFYLKNIYRSIKH